jgi:hypothetical protein
MIELISMFVLMIIIFLILFWLKKTLFLFGFFFKVFMVFLLVCVVGSIVFGYLVVKDANDFKNNFGNSTSIVIVKQTSNDTNINETFLAGVRFNPEKKIFDALSKKDLANAEALYKENKISTLGADYYKVFIVELKSFDEIALYNISDKNVELSKEEIKAVMISSSARETLAGIISKKSGENKADVLDGLAATNEEVKGYLLSYYLSTVFNPSNTVQFISQLKNNNIQVYNSTAMFKAVKLIPQSFINSLVKK